MAGRWVTGFPVWSEAAAGNTETLVMVIYDLEFLMRQYLSTPVQLARQDWALGAPALTAMLMICLDGCKNAVP